MLLKMGLNLPTCCQSSAKNARKRPAHQWNHENRLQTRPLAVQRFGRLLPPTAAESVEAADVTTRLKTVRAIVWRISSGGGG